MKAPRTSRAFALIGTGILLSTTCSNLVNAYTWPNPQLDELESQRYDRIGFNARTVAGSVKPCDRFDFGVSGGRSNAADWIRTAYHDMATFNAAEGTGGLDASIRLERDRPENVGDGFANTLNVVNVAANRFVSLADELALAAIIAYEECGSAPIDFKGGRVDAMVANTAGVPQPQDTLDSHIANFKRQGFTQEEMIGLVACGHTFGGTQHVSFPDIVPANTDPNNTQGNVPFDTTSSQFDTKVLTEYLAGTTKNPLVVGTNDTTNSDKRIFASDKNATVTKLSDAGTFASTCPTLLARMLNSVPKGVTLTDVISPLPVKPFLMQLLHGNSSAVQLSGQVRFWNMQENPKRKVTLLWADKNGTSCSNCSLVLSHGQNQVSTFTPGNVSALWYSFMPPTAAAPSAAVTLDDTTPMAKVWFEVDEGDGSKPVVQDQGGVGFALQDPRLMISNATCMGFPKTVVIAAAVQKGSNPKRVYIKADDFSEHNGTALSLNAIPVVTTIDIPTPNATNPAPVQGNYEVWAVTLSFSDWANGPFNLAADYADGTTVETPYIARPQYPSCAGAAAVVTTNSTTSGAAPAPTGVAQGNEVAGIEVGRSFVLAGAVTVLSFLMAL
ncbi:hypothetical protein EUX98_g890 [Antrodiella citrinella]|uniref:Peroxidase n=1 Tax=Antrodiella citrinella TaxID=2447956 RepID=A0A4S4N2S4_9APHY|nr:hypothetical protein EUX98_g890 [Antrodiella citrinella]